MNIPHINLALQYKDLQQEIDEIVKVTFLRGDFVLGENVTKFERNFSKFNEVKYCISVASGADALLLSLKALGVGSGDEVIAPVFTFIGTVLPIIHLGAKPVLVDINPATYQINVEQIEKVITKKTKVIIPVHLFGIPAPMDEILKIARKYKINVIEDACQAHGTVYHGKKCGSFGNLAAFSFYPTKSLGGAGDGGAIVTNNKKLMDRIRIMRNVGQTKKYQHDMIGYNSRLDTIQAGILSIKLQRLHGWIDKRRQIASQYDRLLSSLPIILSPGSVNNSIPNYVIYTIRTKKRDALLKFLKEKDINCAIYYPIPLHMQKALKYLGYKKGDFPIAEKVSKEVLSLPIYPEMLDSEVKYVCSKIKDFFK